MNDPTAQEIEMRTNAPRTGITSLALLLVGLTLSCTATAGVSSKQVSATNPDYTGFKLSTVVIRIGFDDADAKAVLGHLLAKDLRKRGVTVYRYDDLFPATQTWNDENMRLVHEALSIDGIMLVQRIAEAGNGPSHRSSTHAGRVRYSETSMPTRSSQPSGRYGGGPAAAVGFGEGVSGSAAAWLHGQTAEYQIALVDWTQGREVWTSNIETSVRGDHSRHQQMAKGTVQGIIRGLTQSEHIPKK